jgi:hypothetical protein
MEAARIPLVESIGLRRGMANWMRMMCEKTSGSGKSRIDARHMKLLSCSLGTALLNNTTNCSQAIVTQGLAEIMDSLASAKM